MVFFYTQEVPANSKDSPGGPWEFVGLLPLFDPPRHDSAETIRRALDLGVSVKMITGMFYFYKSILFIYLSYNPLLNLIMQNLQVTNWLLLRRLGDA